MKTTLALLIAGLIFLATPMLAAAHGGDRNDKERKHPTSWVKERHGNHQYRNDYRRDYRHDYRQEKRRHYRAKKHLRREIREHRSEIRHLRHQVKRYERRPYYADSAWLFSAPRVVFHFGW